MYSARVSLVCKRKRKYTKLLHVKDLYLFHFPRELYEFDNKLNAARINFQVHGYNDMCFYVFRVSELKVVRIQLGVGAQCNCSFEFNNQEVVKQQVTLKKNELKTALGILVEGSDCSKRLPGQQYECCIQVKGSNKPTLKFEFYPFADWVNDLPDWVSRGC